MIGCAADEGRGRGTGTDVDPVGMDDGGTGTDASTGSDGSVNPPPPAGRTCASVVQSNSYIGCEYWPVPTSNSQVAEEFEFAVVVANPQPEMADITVTRNGSTVASAKVSGGAVETIKLPWIDELRGTISQEASALVNAGAYKLVSSVPVTVYQFNPLDYEIPQDCSNENPLQDPFGAFDGKCFSYSNDASLLLPTHVLSGDYVVMSRGTMTQGNGTAWASSPGFVNITNTEASASSIEITFSAYTEASNNGSVSAHNPGDTATFNLGAGAVLQLLSRADNDCNGGTSTNEGTTYFCEWGADRDLTGTEIHSDAKLSVIAGHNCTFVPFNKWACDHLEEAMFPLQNWGKDYLVSATQPLRAGEPNFVRIVSGADGATINFEPAVHAPVTLDRGEYVEFEVTEHFRAYSDEAFMVGQFLVGQNYTGDVGAEEVGDPAMSLAIPTEQFRTSYTVLTPSSYAESYLNITAPTGASVTRNGGVVTGWQEIPGTGYSVARVKVNGGSHDLESTEKFGVVIYGFGSFTSYMYPGGLDFEVINPLI